MNVRGYGKRLKFLIFPGWSPVFPLIAIPTTNIDLILSMFAIMPLTAIFDYFGFTIMSLGRYLRSKSIGRIRYIRSPWRYI